MNRIQQIAPITQIQRQPNDVFAKLAAGPVILAKGSVATAVLVSVEQWDRMAEIVEDLTDTNAALRMELAIAKGQAEMMSQAEIKEWLAQDERIPA